MDVTIKIRNIFLKQEIDDCDHYRIFKDDYGQITRHWEVNAIRINDEAFFVPNEKWHQLHGQERKNAYQAAVEDADLAKQFCAGEFYYMGLIAGANITMRIGNETIEDKLYESLWGVESNAGEYMGEIYRRLLNELRYRLSEMGIGMLELDAAFEKFAKTSDKDLRWEVI